MSTVRIDSQGPVTTIALARPHCRNAFDGELVGELTRAFAGLTPTTRVVVLAGDGPVFCAGADLAWMQRSLDYSEAENLAEAERLADMFEAVDSAPCAVIARVQGAALGGGAGLAACCDVVVTEPGARFGFSEVQVGLIPAVVAPFVIGRIGAAKARRYFLTGEIFTAQRALQIGLVDEVAPSTDALEEVTAALAQAVTRAGPAAVNAAKRLVRAVSQGDSDATAARNYTTRALASLRTQPEAQEGLRAFLGKRAPRWS